MATKALMSDESFTSSSETFDWSGVENALNAASHNFEVGASSVSGKSAVAFPGAVLLVGLGGEIVFHKAFGCRSIEPQLSEASVDLVYDVSSLTKVLVTTTLAMLLVDRGQLDLDRRLSRIFQTFGTHGKERMTVRHLLTHCSGYPAHAPFYHQIVKEDRGARTGVIGSRGAIESVYSQIFRARLDNLPGKVSNYSDIGFILLGYALEVLCASHLDRLAQERVFSPLQLKSTGYIEHAKLKRRGLEAQSEMIAPTENCSWRKRILCGEVNDGNAWVMGGVAAHAGVFSNTKDLHGFSSNLIDCWHGRSGIVSKEVVREFWKRDASVPENTYALGWDTPSEHNSSSGKHFSPNSVGHLGFTGCSLWIDPEKELDVILLSNRVHPSAKNEAIRKFRPHIHDLIMETLGFG